MNTDNIPVTINIDIEELKEFVNKINILVKEVMSGTYSESEVYSLGALIEAELDEAAFTRMIQTTDEKFPRLLTRIENDTAKHRVILINYSRGIK